MGAFSLAEQFPEYQEGQPVTVAWGVEGSRIQGKVVTVNRLTGEIEVSTKYGRFAFWSWEVQRLDDNGRDYSAEGGR